MARAREHLRGVVSLMSAVVAVALLLTSPAWATEPDPQTNPETQSETRTHTEQAPLVRVQSSLQCPEEPGEATFAYTAEEMARRLVDPSGVAPRFGDLGVPVDAWRVAEADDGVSLWMAEAGRYFYLIGGEPQVGFVAMLADVTGEAWRDDPEFDARVAMLLNVVNPQSTGGDAAATRARIDRVVETGETVGWVMNQTCWYLEFEEEIEGTDVVILFAVPPVDGADDEGMEGLPEGDFF